MFKRIISLLLITVSALSLLVIPASAAETAFTTADALTVLRHAVGSETLTKEQAAKYDLNGDGKIDTADALIILRLVVGIETTGSKKVDEAPKKPEDKVVTSVDEFEEHFAYASYYAISNIKVRVNNYNILLDLKEACEERSWFSKYGFREIYGSYGSGAVSIHLTYKMYIPIGYADRTGKTDNLTSKEKASYKKLLEIIDEYIPEKGTDYEKVLAAHDYLASNIKYDFTFEADDIYDALINGKAVCEGYTWAFKAIMDIIGIESIVIDGDAGELHTWNMVKLDGKWYHIDITWDRPTNGNKSLNYITHEYFLVTDSYMKETHTWIKENFPAAVTEYKK